MLNFTFQSQDEDNIEMLIANDEEERKHSRQAILGEPGGSVVECRTREREVGGSKPTAAVLCP